jgi:hypothetical protein
MHRLWRGGSTQMQQARMIPGMSSQSVAYGAGLPRGIANLGLARLRSSSSMNTTGQLSGEKLCTAAQQQLRFSATTSEDSASTSTWNGGPTSKQGSTAAAGAAPKRSGWICPYASNYQPRSADFNLHDFVPLTGIPYVPPQPALTSTSTSGSSAASTVGAKGGDEGSAAVVAQQQTVGSSGKVESSTNKKQYLTTTFRRYRYVDQGSAVVSDGQHLVQSLTPLDLGNDVDFACLYLNACVMFDAPPPPPSMLNHLREIILPRLQTAAQVEAVLSALWLLCGPGSRSFDRRKSATRQRLAGGFPSRRSEDSVPAKSAAPSSSQSAQVSQEAPSSDSSLTNNSASTGWEAFLRAVAPQLDALVPTMSKNTLVLTACIYGQSSAATPLLMQGLLERGVMLKESFTPHDTAQFLFSLVTCPCFADSPEIPELFSEFSAQIVDKINQTAAEDAARLLYAFALAKMASAEVIDVLGRRLYFVVHAVSPDAVGMTFSAMVLMGLDAPLLRKSLCEAIRYMDPADFSPLSALDIAWGLTQFPTSNSLGASRIGAEADILDLIMSRILQDKATILATEDSRNKLLAVSIALGSSSPGQSGGPATQPSLQ